VATVCPGRLAPAGSGASNTCEDDRATEVKYGVKLVIEKEAVRSISKQLRLLEKNWWLAVGS
jgi:hypothetical protein